MPHYFNLAEAESLLPKLEHALRDALFHKAEAQRAEDELEGVNRRIRTSGGTMVNPGRLLTVRSLRDSSALALREALESIEEAGAVVKDLEIGLIDFMSRYEHKEVCLCWKLGETGIGFWHSLEEGFRGRKPIDDAFLQGHSGDSPQQNNSGVN